MRPCAHLSAATAALLLLSASCTPAEPPEQGEPGTGATPAETYLGQEPPGPEPTVFAPGIVSTRLSETGLTVSPDGMEVVVSVGISRVRAILLVSQEGDGWGEPRVAPFSGHHDDWEPVFSPDGRRLYFVSNRPTADRPEDTDGNLWYVERTADGWSEPFEVGPPVNTAEYGEGYPSVTRDGTLYFFRYSNEDENLTQIYRAECGTGACAEPEMLGPEVNSPFHDWDPFIAPDESYLIFSSPGRPDSHGDADFYISFRREDGEWTEAVNMGPQVNAVGREICPFVSHDGRYLFFEASTLQDVLGSEPPPPLQRPQGGAALTYEWLMEMADERPVGRVESYWMDAGVIQELRRQVLGG